MCLAVPMRIESIDGSRASCAAGGITRHVELFLVQDRDPRPGDYVLVHVGYAIQMVSAEEALAAWALLDELEVQANA